MHKKVQALLIVGIVLATNALSPVEGVFADTIKIENDVEIEKRTEGETSTEGIVHPHESEWAKFSTVQSLSGYWNYELVDNDSTVLLKSYIGSDKNTKVEIPRTIDGKSVELESLNKNTFQNVTHIKIAQGEGNEVKLKSNSLCDAFRNTQTLEYADLRGLDITNVRSLWCAFSDNDTIKYLDLSGWDTSKVADFTEMVYGVETLKYMDISGWNTSSHVSDGLNLIFHGTGIEDLIIKNVDLETYRDLRSGMIGMRSENLTLDITGIKIPEDETSFEGLFSISSLVKIIGFDNVDTSKITDMSNLFKNASRFTNIEFLKDWNTDSLENMGDMFDGCGVTDFSPIENWNTSNVTMMNGVFYRCSNVTSLDLSNWDTRKVTNMNGMFKDATKLNSITFGENWNTEKVTTMNEIFSGTNNLNFIDLSRWKIQDGVNINDWFTINSDVEDKRLLVVTDNERIQQYNFSGSNRTKVQTIFDAGEGHFHTANGENIKRMVRERYVISPDDIATEIQNAKEFAGVPVRDGYIFGEWTTNKNLENASVFEMLDITFTPVWGELIAGPETEDNIVTGVDEIEIIKEGNGSSEKPFELKANTEEGLDKILNWVKDENKNYHRFGNPTKVDNVVKYELQVFNNDDSVNYLNISVDKDSQTLVNKLNDIKESDKNGEITIKPDENGGITIKPGQNGEKPSYDNNGNINIPNGGTVETPNGSITAPGGTVNPENGEVSMPNGGSIELPSGDAIELPSDTTINTEGEIVIPENGGSVNIPNGPTIELPNGGVIKPGNDSIELPNGGNITTSNGSTVTVPNGSTITQEGTVETPGGTTIDKDGLITVPGTNDDSNIQIPSTEGNTPSINDKGEVTLPNEGTIILPGGNIQVTVPQNSTIKPGGTIETSNENVVIKPNGNIEISGENNIVIPPIINGDNTVTVPTVNENGEVTMPNVGKVELPGGESIIVPSDTVIKPNGDIVVPEGGSIAIPEQNGNSVIIKPSVDSAAPSVNNDGDIVLSGGTTVELPNNVTMVVPNGTTVKPNGDIQIPNGESITIPGQNNDDNTVVRPEITIKPGIDNKAPTIDAAGNVTIPNGAIVELPSGNITLPSESIMKPNGEIEIPSVDNNEVIVVKPEGEITVPGGATIKPNENGHLPTINENGSVTLPNESVVELANKVGEVTVPGNSIVKPNGSIVVQKQGEVKLPNGDIVQVKPGTVINPNGTIEGEVKPTLPSIFDKLNEEVVTIEKGEGSSNNPLVLTVKPVEVVKLNTFLNSLNDLNPKVVKVTKGNIDTEYKLEVDNLNTSISKITYATIKVANGKTDLLKALNKFAKTTNAIVSIPNLVSFIDLEGHWAKANIADFASMGLINGYIDGSFKPNDSITRAEFVKIVNSVFGYTVAGKVTFTDINKEDWFYNDVAIAAKAGYINGKSVTTFAPNDKITRQEVAKILTTIMKNSDDKLDKLNTFKDGNLTHDWAKSYVEGAIEAGYLSGDTEGNLNPINNITRAEAVTVLSRIKK